MALRTILEYPDPRLRTRAQPVTQFDAELGQLVDDMFETMYAAPGVGLAAPQVNVSKRFFVMDVHDEEHDPAVVINPKLEEAEEEIELREGCLSVPGLVGEITRFKRVVVSGLDRRGQKIRIEGEGLLAQCLQHEIDHLNGKLYVDRAQNLRPAVSDEERETAEAAEA
jgi:peptide deformylase